jgi:branched-chain amino acid transport system substrate-binding protein
VIDRRTFVTRAGRLGLSAAAASALGFRLIETPAANAAPLPPVRDTIAAAGGATIKIGHVNGFTGVYSSQALACESGVQLAIEEANRQYGGRVTFTSVRGDDTSTPLIGRYEARRLILDEKVDVLMGQVSSAVAVEVSNVAQQYGVVYFTHGFDTDLTGPLANRCCFRANVSSAMLVRALVPSLIKEGKRWFFAVANYNYGIDAHRRLGDALRAAGGQEVGSQLHPLGTRDFSGVVRAAKASNADVLVFSNLGGDTTYSVRAAVDAGLHHRMRFGGIVCDDESMIGMPVDEIVGSQFGYVWGAGAGNSSGAAIYDKIRGRAKTFPPDWRQYLGYVTAQLAIDRIMSGRSTETETLIKALENHEYDAGKSSRNLVRDCDHQIVQDTYVATVQPKNKRRSTYEYLAISSVLPAKDAGGSCDPEAAAVFAKQGQLAARPDYTPISNF